MAHLYWLGIPSGWAYATQRSATLIARHLGGSAGFGYLLGFPSRLHPEGPFTQIVCCILLYIVVSFCILLEYRDVNGCNPIRDVI